MTLLDYSVHRASTGFTDAAECAGRKLAVMDYVRESVQKTGPLPFVAFRCGQRNEKHLAAVARLKQCLKNGHTSDREILEKPTASEKPRFGQIRQQG